MIKSNPKDITTLGAIIKKILYLLFSFDIMIEKPLKVKQCGGSEKSFVQQAELIGKTILVKIKSLFMFFFYAAMYPVIPMYAAMSATFAFLTYFISNFRIF